MWHDVMIEFAGFLGFFGVVFMIFGFLRFWAVFIRPSIRRKRGR